MNAIPSLNASRCRAGCAAAFLALIGLIWSTQALAEEEAPAEEQSSQEAGHVPAVLKIHEFKFLYSSSAVHLSCAALEGRVASVLLALGARHDLWVRASGCDAVVGLEDEFDDMRPGHSDPWQSSSDRWGAPSDRWGDSSDRWGTSSDRWNGSRDQLRNRKKKREQTAHVSVRAMMPVEVTLEVLQEIDRDKSRRELISRMTRDPTAGLDDPIIFPARRQLVTLSKQTLGLQPEECELLAHISSNIFRQLDMRVVGGSPSCSRGQVSRFPPQITVEALMPVMPEVPQLMPEGGESDPDPGAPASEAGSSEPEPPAPSE